MDRENAVFDQTFNSYLNQFKQMSLDHLKNNQKVKVQGRDVIIPFFNNIFYVSETGIKTESGIDVPFEVCIVVFNYLLRYRGVKKNKNAWVAYRDTKNSGPLTVYFAGSVENKIIMVYGRKESSLTDACLALGGRVSEEITSFDVAMVFDALPDCPILLLFNYEDEDFKASCSVLFEEGVEQYLDPESLAILGAVFASKLAGYVDKK